MVRRSRRVGHTNHLCVGEVVRMWLLSRWLVVAPAERGAVALGADGQPLGKKKTGFASVDQFVDGWRSNTHTPHTVCAPRCRRARRQGAICTRCCSSGACECLLIFVADPRASLASVVGLAAHTDVEQWHVPACHAHSRQRACAACASKLTHSLHPVLFAGNGAARARAVDEQTEPADVGEQLDIRTSASRRSVAPGRSLLIVFCARGCSWRRGRASTKQRLTATPSRRRRSGNCRCVCSRNGCVLRWSRGTPPPVGVGGQRESICGDTDHWCVVESGHG